MAVLDGVEVAVPLKSKTYRIRRYLEFPIAEYEARCTKVQARLREADLDGVLVTTAQNNRYFTGFRSLLYKTRLRPILALIPSESARAPLLVVPEVLEGCAAATSWVTDIRSNVECYGRTTTTMLQEVMTAVQSLGNRTLRIGAELGTGMYLGMTHDDFLELGRLLPNVEWVDAAELIWGVRAIKSPLEIEALQTACDIGAAGVLAAADALKPGMSELELERIVTGAYYAAGAEEHMLIFASGAKGYQVRDAPASDHLFQRGHVTKIDGGVMYKGYWSEFCRMLAIPPVQDVHMAAMRASIAGNDAAISAVRAGTPISSLVELAVAEVGRRGFSTYMNTVGHNVGLEPHEPPWLSGDNHRKLETGMALSIENGVITDTFDDGSFTFEENMIVTDSSARILTRRVPAEPIIV